MQGGASHILRIAIEDAAYPPQLREISDPPAQLYVRGNTDALTSRPIISIVGSRASTAYGHRVVCEFVPALVHAAAICSGLALGIDAAAHAATLECGGITVAVLGSGVDDESIYPKSHIRLAHRIIAHGGCIVSEYPPGTAARPYHFPERNRIVAGLARAIMIVEADEKSGTLITAKSALDYNRDVFAVPGSVFSSNSRGTHRLLSRGAHVAASPADILASLGVITNEPHQPSLLLAPDECALFKHISTQPISLDALAQKLLKPVSEIAQIMMRLELAGVVTKVPGRGYTV
jgi:DNA processing protein